MHVCTHIHRPSLHLSRKNFLPSNIGLIISTYVIYIIQLLSDGDGSGTRNRIISRVPRIGRKMGENAWWTRLPCFSSIFAEIFRHNCRFFKVSQLPTLGKIFKYDKKNLAEKWRKKTYLKLALNHGTFKTRNTLVSCTRSVTTYN